jgi:hypothetical protein
MSTSGLPLSNDFSNKEPPVGSLHVGYYHLLLRCRLDSAIGHTYSSSR